jgi:hypothetical protein
MANSLDKLEAGNDITPEQALKNLDIVCSQLSATREVHELILKSVELLRKTIKQQK